MDEIAKTERKIRKWLLANIAVHERWQLWAPIAALMVISAAHAVRLYRFIKRESKKKVN